MKKTGIFHLTFWKSVAIVIVASGLFSTYLRFTEGLKAVTNLSDSFPWGIWIGFDILCGVGLAAGGFTICAVTHIFNIEKFKPLTKSAVLTAFLGYVLVIFGLMYDLGKPYNIWHAIIMWNPKSVMFEVAWCVMLYTTVLFLEFSPVFLEKFGLKRILSIIRKISLPIMILGVLLSTLHQSSLGSLFLIVPAKMYPLWYSPILPVYFYISAIGVGLAMVIFESYLSARAFGHSLNIELLSKLGLVSIVVLLINLLVKSIDFIISGKLSLLTIPGTVTYLFYLEIILGTIIPIVILSSRKNRNNRMLLYFASICIIGGFLLNRMNVSITSINLGNGNIYFPSIYELSITAMLVVLGMWAFKLIVSNFPVFDEEHQIEGSKFEYDPAQTILSE
jgi:Ni/Fe-hydrogenase subunit HybB-like protein